MDLLRILFVCVGCLVLVKAAPQDKVIQIVSQSSELEANGNYKYSYETENGIKFEETGILKKGSGKDSEDSIGVQGQVSYKDNEGNEISWSYTSDDENGFVPVGAHIPTPPPIPEAILKSLEYNAAHPEEDEQPKGRR